MLAPLNGKQIRAAPCGRSPAATQSGHQGKAAVLQGAPLGAIEVLKCRALGLTLNLKTSIAS